MITLYENLENARKFCSEVKQLSNKYNLPFFMVTDGASITKNNNCEAVRHARLCHEKWEKSHGYNPKEDWNK